ncbi:MAG: adenylyltransferase/cytidyltransferase family protein [Bacilli bacterium]
MKTVITYGTFDLLHEGHINLLKRARALGDYLIVGITSDTFDKERGKINVTQSLTERIAAVKATGLADKIIVEEYEGQKIDDIKRYNVDIFTLGSDWVGKFDYLSAYCKVVYLDRTEGISSSEIRAEESHVRIGIVGGEEKLALKFINEATYINGAAISGILKTENLSKVAVSCPIIDDYQKLLSMSDAIYIVSAPQTHYSLIKKALLNNKHVLCESPLVMNTKEWAEIKALANNNKLVLMDSLKTAYSTAYYRLLLMVKGNVIGDAVSIDATSTSLSSRYLAGKEDNQWPSICFWGVTNMLPVFQILGCNYKAIDFVTRYADKKEKLDLFTKADFIYDHATATIKSGIGIKSEGDLVVSGTKGYIYVPAPWWKTDYFEIRYENPSDNRKVFYQLEGEGIRYEILSFVKSIRDHKDYSYISDDVSKAIVKTVESYYAKKNVTSI